MQRKPHLCLCDHEGAAVALILIQSMAMFQQPSMSTSQRHLYLPAINAIIMQRRKRFSKTRGTSGTQNDSTTHSEENTVAQANNQESTGVGAVNVETARNRRPENVTTVAAAGAADGVHKARPEEEESTEQAQHTENEGGVDLNGNINIDGDLDTDGEGDAVWTPAREDRLIDLFRECTFLYDKNTAGFLQRNKKELAYARIATLLGVTGKDNSLMLSLRNP